MTDKPRILLVLNHSAGNGRRGWLDVVRGALERRFCVECVAPAAPEVVARALHEGLDRGAALVAVAGGDGTVHRVVNLLAGRPMPLGLLPLGTANDLARELRIPLDPAEAARLLLRGRPHRIDLLDAGGMRVCTAGGMGLTAESARLARSLRGLRLGAAVYPVAAAARILGPSGPSLHVELRWQAPGEAAERRLETETPGLFLANQGTCGGGLAFCPGAQNRDGVFEICLLPRVSRLALLHILGKMRLGLPLGPGEMTVVPAERATLRLDRPCRLFADGEPLGSEAEVHVSIRPQALEIIA